MKKRQKKIIGAAAGAAAATAVGIAAVTLKNRQPTVLHVRPSDQEGWTLGAEGARDGGARYDTKRAAVTAGRDLAAARAPSRLIIHRRDNSVQTQHSYEKE